MKEFLGAGVYTIWENTIIEATIQKIRVDHYLTDENENTYVIYYLNYTDGEGEMVSLQRTKDHIYFTKEDIIKHL